MTRKNIKLVIAYQGTRYSGWQRQKDAPTVQETIEQTLSQLVGYSLRIRGCSRTDAGVHAEEQAANFIVENCPIPTHAFAWILNGRLPADIAVRQSVEVPLNFHASRDALNKTYTYRIYTGKGKDVFAHNFRWHVGYPLNVEQMNQAARLLLGTHDFQAFASAKDTRDNAIRTVLQTQVAWMQNEHELMIMIKANRYLYHMVRNIVGTLVEIGRGRWSVDRIAQVIASRDRSQAGPTAPPQGLCLKSIEYPKNFTSPLDFDAPIDNIIMTP